MFLAWQFDWEFLVTDSLLSSPLLFSSILFSSDAKCYPASVGFWWVIAEWRLLFPCCLFALLAPLFPLSSPLFPHRLSLLTVRVLKRGNRGMARMGVGCSNKGKVPSVASFWKRFLSGLSHWKERVRMSEKFLYTNEGFSFTFWHIEDSFFAYAKTKDKIHIRKKQTRNKNTHKHKNKIKNRNKKQKPKNNKQTKNTNTQTHKHTQTQNQKHRTKTHTNTHTNTHT